MLGFDTWLPCEAASVPFPIAGKLPAAPSFLSHQVHKILCWKMAKGTLRVSCEYE